MMISFVMDWSTRLGDNFTYEEWKRVRPKNVIAYCGCKCITIDYDGHGMLEVCEMHKEKIKKNGIIRIPKMKIEIEPSFLQKLWWKIKEVI